MLPVLEVYEVRFPPVVGDGEEVALGDTGYIPDRDGDVPGLIILVLPIVGDFIEFRFKF